ncbi:hypothetical protein [Nonomuraea salmonea]|uniref:Uncharacterized protein n=1 Tax=Nonomuraea salmonea TaxID=46181 RepID=A0ABV5P3F9_9ACTN
MEVVRYFRSAAGSVSQITESGSGCGRVKLPDDVVEISEGEYRQAVADLADADERHVAGLVEADERRRLADLEALTAAGIPEATARRLAGIAGD